MKNMMTWILNNNIKARFTLTLRDGSSGNAMLWLKFGWTIEAIYDDCVQFKKTSGKRKLIPYSAIGLVEW